MYNYIACIKLVSLKLMNGFAVVTQLLLMQKWVVSHQKQPTFISKQNIVEILSVLIVFSV